MHVSNKNDEEKDTKPINDERGAVAEGNDVPDETENKESELLNGDFFRF